MPSTKRTMTEYLLSQLAAWDVDDEHLEIADHRVECLGPGLIQYNFLPKSGDGWIRGFGVHCPEDRIEEVKERLQSRWLEPRSSGLLLPDSAAKIPSKVFLTSTSSDRCVQTERVGNWVSCPQDILERLENSSSSEKDRLAAVLFAETKSFDGKLRPRLLNALQQFIEANRLTEDADRMIYVCSAIRKYAMNMEQDKIDAYTKWVLPTDTAPVHHEVEMEFVKGLSYRLQFEKLSLPFETPYAIECLSDIAFAYLRKSLILQKSYANTTMFVIVCIAILESLSETQTGLTNELLGKVDSLGITWFQEMVEDNLEEAMEFVETNNPDVAFKLHALLGNK
jgi:hypothetical protein